MTPKVLILLTVAAAASAFPSTIYDFKTDYMDIEQKGTPGKSVEGEYSWVAPNGRKIYVKYIADRRGFRVLDSKNNFNDWDFDRSSSSSAGDEENYSIQEISPVKASQTKVADVPKAAKFSSLTPAAPVAAPATKSESNSEPKTAIKKEPASVSHEAVIKKYEDSAATVAEKEPVLEETTVIAEKDAAAAEGAEGADGAEGEEGAEEGGEEGGEAEEGGEEAENEEEAEAEENEEV